MSELIVTSQFPDRLWGFNTVNIKARDLKLFSVCSIHPHRQIMSPKKTFHFQFCCPTIYISASQINFLQN